jgi:hypothetical protein
MRRAPLLAGGRSRRLRGLPQRTQTFALALFLPFVLINLGVLLTSIRRNSAFRDGRQPKKHQQRTFVATLGVECRSAANTYGRSGWTGQAR